MKRIKKISFILLGVTTVLMIGFNGYGIITSDKEPPVITCPDTELSVSVSVTEEELLKDVKAEDNKVGDVTSSVVVEKMSSIDEESTRIITYAAIDEAGNVGRKERTVKYTDYRKPRFNLTEPLRFPLGKIPDNMMTNMHAESVVDGDISEKVKFQFTGDQYLNQEGMVDIEIRVADSAGVSSVLTTQVEIYDAKTENIKVKLSDYLIYLPIGASFNANDYYAGADQEGSLKVESNVNTSTPGTYHVNYTVQGRNSVGRSSLIVVVEKVVRKELHFGKTDRSEISDSMYY